MRLRSLALLTSIVSTCIWVHAGQAANGTMVRENDVPIPMRDGVTLRADVMRPAAPGRYPTLVYRTPYNKE